MSFRSKFVKTQLTLATWVSFLCGHRKGLVGWRFRQVGRHLVRQHRHPVRDAELAVFTGLYIYVYILYWYQYYYIFLWCKTRKTNTFVNCVDTYMYHRNSVDTYRSFRLSFPIVCCRELQFDDCQNSHLNQSLALDLLNLVLDSRIKSTYHNLLWKTAVFLSIKRNFRDRN